MGVPGVDSGCTAVAALLLEGTRQCFVANAGDSRCVLCRAGVAVDLSKDHNPDGPLENARILAAGGYVTEENRICGNLNLSRAFGDHRYKRNAKLAAQKQMITVYPEVWELTLQKDDEFLVLACDGIWGVMSSEDVITFVRRELNEEKKSCAEAAAALIQACLADDPEEHPGTDNMTALVVQLGGCWTASRVVKDTPTQHKKKKSRHPRPCLVQTKQAPQTRERKGKRKAQEIDHDQGSDTPQPPQVCLVKHL